VRRDELLNAGVFGTLGAVILAASWRMDRLADRGIDGWSVPGLTPGVVGALMILLSLALAWKARSASDAPVPDDKAAAPGSARRTLAAVVLCVLFAGITLGHGLPFVVEGAVFIFVFTALFSWHEWRVERRICRGLAQTLAVAVLASAFISWLFESMFLVRLP
jgi:hypothetical protein